MMTLRPCMAATNPLPAGRGTARKQETGYWASTCTEALGETWIVTRRCTRHESAPSFGEDAAASSVPACRRFAR